MNCPKCGHAGLPEDAHFCAACGAAIVAVPEPAPERDSREAAAQLEVDQQIGTMEGGQAVGVSLGQVLGDVNIGAYTLRIGTLNGGVVNLVSPEEHRPPRLRPVPVMLLPRPLRGFLDREDEVAAATAVLEGTSPVEFHGPAGIGKTALLRNLAHHTFAPVFPDGVVFFPETRHKPVEDLLFDLFDAFYEREPTHIPTPVQVRHELADKHALIVLDDVDLGRDELAALMSDAPGCAFLMASVECCLWGDGRAVALRGLPPEDALALAERELGRELTAEERAAVTELCDALEGHPLELLRLAVLARDDGRPLAEIAERVRGYAGPATRALAELALAERPESERRVLAALASSMGASAGGRYVDAVSGVEDSGPALDSLQRRKLVQAHSPRYTLAGSLDEVLREDWDLSPLNERALEHLATWAEEHRQHPGDVIEESDAIVGVLRWAAQTGRWEEALRLGRAAEGPLVLGGRWGAWDQVLDRQLEAARALGDRGAEAWSLHQSGTRALCLEDTSVARADLTEALRLRESLGDEEGAAVTRHNLGLLGGPGGDHRPQQDGGGGRGWRMWLGITGLVVALIALLAALVWGLPNEAEVTTLSSLKLDRDEVEAGETSRATVTLSAPAPQGGTVVKLSSSRPKVAEVDPRVTVGEGETTATFVVSTSPLSSVAFALLSSVASQTAGPTGTYPRGVEYAQSASEDQYDGVITLTTPANGAEYVIDQRVLADFSCADHPPGYEYAEKESCDGTVPDGKRIDTGTVGHKKFTVTAIYSGYEVTSLPSITRTHEYEVVPRDDEGGDGGGGGTDGDGGGGTDQPGADGDGPSREVVRVTITASSRGEDRSATLTVRGV